MTRKDSESELEELPLFDLPLQETAPSAPRPRRPAAESRQKSAPAAPHLEDQPELEELAELEEVPAVAFERATIGDRFFAGLADLLINALCLGAAAAVTVMVIGHDPNWQDLFPFLIFGLLFSFLYSVFSLAFWGQTPGMIWAGHLARSVTNEPLTFGQTFLRWLGGLLTLILLGLPLLLAVAGGRSLSDRISDSKTLQL